MLAAAPPDVLNHNLETVPRLYKQARPGADYAHSLKLLADDDTSVLPPNPTIRAMRDALMSSVPNRSNRPGERFSWTLRSA